MKNLIFYQYIIILKIIFFDCDEKEVFYKKSVSGFINRFSIGKNI